ncbi:AraC family transcriptional regulator [Zoogloea sp. LCSB751]|uniref:AraC family transcriptional regulator n=1 Tax=Zoogloea sp. LCSB751 TaxID=1965277 RepID=UPI0009A4EC85|nr:AraC family transcriptional regulator [Zoogloea sp. LCSB751]
MGSLISPQDLPTWVPGRVLSASDGLGWKDVGHRSYLYTGLDVAIPPVDHYMVVRYRTGQTPMDRRVEGRWTRRQCAPGEFSLLTRSEPSHWHWTECIEVSHTYLSDALMQRVAADITERAVADIRLHDVLQARDPVVMSIVDAIAAEAERTGFGGSLYVEALSIQLAVHLFRHYACIQFRDEVPAGPLSPARMRRLNEFLDSHLQDSISIEQMAATLGLGVWTFSKHFRATTGASPYDYVTRRRLERAVRLLTAGELAIKEVAVDCGFSDQAHLTRVMRARMGTTPARMRKEGGSA